MQQWFKKCRSRWCGEFFQIVVIWMPETTNNRSSFQIKAHEAYINITNQHVTWWALPLEVFEIWESFAILKKILRIFINIVNGFTYRVIDNISVLSQRGMTSSLSASRFFILQYDLHIGFFPQIKRHFKHTLGQHISNYKHTQYLVMPTGQEAQAMGIIWLLLRSRVR